MGEFHKRKSINLAINIRWFNSSLPHYFKKVMSDIVNLTKPRKSEARESYYREIEFSKEYIEDLSKRQPKGYKKLILSHKFNIRFYMVKDHILSLQNQISSFQKRLNKKNLPKYDISSLKRSIKTANKLMADEHMLLEHYNTMRNKFSN